MYVRYFLNLSLLSVITYRYLISRFDVIRWSPTIIGINSIFFLLLIRHNEIGWFETHSCDSSPNHSNSSVARPHQFINCFSFITRAILSANPMDCVSLESLSLSSPSYETFHCIGHSTETCGTHVDTSYDFLSSSESYRSALSLK